MMHPPHDGGVSQRQAAFGRDLHQVSEAELEAQVPPHTQDNYLAIKVPTLKQFIQTWEPGHHTALNSPDGWEDRAAGKLHQSQELNVAPAGLLAGGGGEQRRHRVGASGSGVECAGFDDRGEDFLVLSLQSFVRIASRKMIFSNRLSTLPFPGTANDSTIAKPFALLIAAVVRQLLSGRVAPLILDETDEDAESMGRLQRVISLLRLASGGAGGKVVKGSGEGRPTLHTFTSPTILGLNIRAATDVTGRFANHENGIAPHSCRYTVGADRDNEGVGTKARSGAVGARDCGPATVSEQSGHGPRHDPGRRAAGRPRSRG
jgi:hypothetical protein